MIIAEFECKRDIFFLFRPFVSKKKPTFLKAKMVMDNKLMLNPLTIIKFNHGLKMIVHKSKDGVIYLKSIRKELLPIKPESYKILPWKYISPDA